MAVATFQPRGRALCDNIPIPGDGGNYHWSRVKNDADYLGANQVSALRSLLLHQVINVLNSSASLHLVFRTFNLSGRAHVGPLLPWGSLNVIVATLENNIRVMLQLDSKLEFDVCRPCFTPQSFTMPKNVAGNVKYLF